MATEGWIDLDGHQAARLLFKGLGARVGAGMAQLTVNVELASRQAAADNRPLWLGGDVSVDGVGRGSGYVGRLHTTIQPTTLPERGGTRDLTLAVDLAYAQLQEIEDHRIDTVKLRFDLAGHWLIDGAPRPFWSVQIQHEATRSEWINLLEQMRYRRIMLIELAVPDGRIDPAHAEAREYFTDAQKHYLGHEWRLTVESLRQALAALVGKMPDQEDSEAEVQAGLRTVRRTAGKSQVGCRERYELVRQATKFLCDLGAHPEAAETTKQDAYAALLVTGGLLHGLARS